MSERDLIITNLCRRKMARRKEQYKKQIITKILSIVAMTLIISGTIGKTVFTKAAVAEPISEDHPRLINEIECTVEQISENVVHKPEEPRLLNPVEAGFRGDPDRYYIPWMDFINPHYSISMDEFKLICVTTACEGGCTREYLQRNKLIAKTILNRVASDLFPDNVSDVIFQQNQYCVTDWPGFPEAYMDRVTEDVEEAVFLAIAQDDVPLNLYFFRTGYPFSWADDYWNDGWVYFSKRRE